MVPRAIGVPETCSGGPRARSCFYCLDVQKGEVMKPLLEYGREDVVRFLYLEPLLQDQRVLVLGPENETVRQVFSRLGCTSVKLLMPGREVLPDWDLTFLRGKRDLMEENKRLLPFSAGAFDITSNCASKH